MKDKIKKKLKEAENLLSFKTEDERLDFNASIIQLDILAEVARLMDERNISREQLAEKLGISRRKLSNLFSVDTFLDLKTISKFEKIFDVRFKCTVIENKTA